MELQIDDARRLVGIWLRNDEKEDPALRARLRDICRVYDAEKYLVAVYESGEKDLYQNTLALLANHKHRFAEPVIRAVNNRQDFPAAAILNAPGPHGTMIPETSFSGTGDPP